jgi:peptidyl-prolyl cis-trans isomerase D
MQSYLICLRRSLWTIRFGNYYAVSKSMGKNGVNAKASHILISYEGTKVNKKKSNELKKKPRWLKLYSKLKANRIVS